MEPAMYFRAHPAAVTVKVTLTAVRLSLAMGANVFMARDAERASR